MVDPLVIFDLLVAMAALAEQKKMRVLLALMRAENVGVGFDFVQDARFFELQEIAIDAHAVDVLLFFESADHIALAHGAFGVHESGDQTFSQGRLFKLVLFQDLIDSLFVVFARRHWSLLAGV